MRAIDVVLQNSTAGPDPKVVIDAVWARTHREHIEVSISNLDSANVAAGISRGLAELADRIASNITR